MNYIGKKCVKCQKAFTSDDDIVVCPDCGSPHHRECYKELNKCALEELHTTGFLWKNPADEADENKEDMVKCSSCGMPMSKDDEVCPHCSEPNEETIQQQKSNDELNKTFRRVTGMNPDFDMGGVSAFELLFFVKVNVPYYAAYFKQISATKHKLSLNILCLFFPSIYFANRRMWLWAVISSIISVLLTIPYAIGTLVEMSMNSTGFNIFSERVMNLLTESSNEINTVISICNGLDFFVRLLFCLFANLMYYRFAVHSIKKMRAKTGTKMLSNIDLLESGGVRIMNTPLIILISAAMTMMAVYASVMILENFL